MTRQDKETKLQELLEFCISCSFANTDVELVKAIESKLTLLLPFRNLIILLVDEGVHTISKIIHCGFSNQQFSWKVLTGYELHKLGSMQALGADALKYLVPGFDPDTVNIADLTLKRNEKILGRLIFAINKNTAVLEFQQEFFNRIASQITAAILNIRLQEAFSAHKQNAETALHEVNVLKRKMDLERLYDHENTITDPHCDDIIGAGEPIKKVFNLIQRVAPTSSSVLIMGETGTGKEMIARAIHNNSTRRQKSMVKINCAAIPPNLIESELFGHERGSFTGATERRIGKFELANNSTLFLDEIGELPPELQVKLLRALQEREIERVGGCKTIKIDVRIIAATNKDLFTEVQIGNFRSDLFFRLNIFPIIVPPLRERREDIPALAVHFLCKYTSEAINGRLAFSSRVMKQLMAYQWPGNVRELEHLIERTVVLNHGKIIKNISLPVIDSSDAFEAAGSYVKTINEVEREHILAVLKLCKGKVAGIGGAAEILKIPSTTLNSKIRRLKIKKEYRVQN
jgi:transcriptional regulator with GAF, ATPase, and Fis domain